MGIFRQFPYTNFHELNLDWLLDKMKTLGIDVEAFKTEILNDFNELENEFEDFTFSVDSKIIEEVDKWLDEHPEATTTVEDGSITLAKLAKSLTYTILCPPIYNFDNIGRLPYKRFAKAGMQGGICTGNNIFYQYSRNDTELIKFNLASGLVINRTEVDLGHCNSMAFIENENKLLCFGTFGENSLPYNRVSIFDGDTLVLIDEVDLTLPTDITLNVEPVWEYGYMCSFDNEKSKFYIAGQRYVKQTTESYIIRYGYANGTFTLENYGVLPDTLATSASDMCYFNGANYILTSEAPQIVIIDDNYDIVHTVPVSRCVSSLTYATEFESISIVDGEIIVGYVSTCFKNRYGGGSYVYAKSAFRNSPNSASTTTPEFTKVNTLYVDNNNDDYHRDGSASNPFSNIYEALNCSYNFEMLTIYDNSVTEDSFVIAVETGQHIVLNAENSAIRYGIIMDGGYLYCIRPSHSTFTYNKLTYTMRLENGAQCLISDWNKTGEGVNVTLDSDSVELINGAELSFFNSVLTNLDCFKYIAPSAVVRQMVDLAPNNTGIIRDDAPSDIRPKNLRGFKATISGTPANKFIPIQCQIMLKVTINSNTYNLSGVIMGTPCSWFIDGNKITLSVARTNQWGKVTITADEGVTINNFDCWIPT